MCPVAESVGWLCETACSERISGMESIEEPLSGANVSGAVRIGAHVHRQVHERSTYVHELLSFLAEHGFDGSPRLSGLSEDGREILDYLPGDMHHGRPAPGGWAKVKL